MKKQILITSFIILFIAFDIKAQDSIAAIKYSLKFKGEISSWAHYNPKNPYPLYIGGRYIPQLNYNIQLAENKLIDFEASANLNGDAGLDFFDSASVEGKIKPYRLWGRYSSEQMEIRIGMQKINFGSATMLRALRWFDQVDPRDPLQLTKGVWGVLARYYFLNNANIWLWGLYANKNPKGFELAKTNLNYPEFGGRFQCPILGGEAAITFNHRIADFSTFTFINPDDKIPENKIGIDFKLDLVVGLWFEGVWVNKNKNIGDLTNQEVISLGTDYTFGIGNGLNVVLEHMLLAADEKAFSFSDTKNFSAFSLGYPIGMFDNINAIIYYDWDSKSAYNFINWHRQFDSFTFYLMGYWNPKDNNLPMMGSVENLYGGKGLQIMFVYDY